MSSHKPRHASHPGQEPRAFRQPIRAYPDFSPRRRLKDLRVYSSVDSSRPSYKCYPPPLPPPPPPPPPLPHRPPHRPPFNVYRQHDRESPDSLSSGYLSIYSQEWGGGVWQRSDQGEMYSSMAELGLEREMYYSMVDQDLGGVSTSRQASWLPRSVREMRNVSVQTSQPLPSPLPIPRALDRPERAIGCCNNKGFILTTNREDREDSDEQNQSKIKSFFSWVSSKAVNSGGKYIHVIMIGLDGAGKTTALYMMKLDQFLNTVPTIGFNCERVKGSLGSSAGTTFLIWDVGGQEKIRPLWRTYTRNTDGIIFVLDSADHRSFEEARIELHRTLSFQKQEKEAATPLLILANKQDLGMALNERQVVTSLSLRQLGRDQQWGIVLTCAKTGLGLDTGLEMLHMMIMKRKMMNKRIRNKTK